MAAQKVLSEPDIMHDLSGAVERQRAASGQLDLAVDRLVPASVPATRLPDGGDLSLPRKHARVAHAAFRRAALDSGRAREVQQRRVLADTVAYDAVHVGVKRLRRHGVN